MTISAPNVLLRSQAKGGRATIRFVGSGTIVVQSNSTVNSDLSFANDTITGASISGVWWSVSGNTITVARGATPNSEMVLSGTGNWDASSGWLGDAGFPQTNVVITFGTGGTGVIYMEFAKQFANSMGGNVIE